MREARDRVFISHANPEDNEFTLWLAAKLASEGYVVWCDLTRLLGGEQWWGDIEDVIRHRCAKLLYVLSRASNHKPGPRKELQVAENVAREEGLQDFVIPLRIDDLPHREINIQLASLNAITLQGQWGLGLEHLLRKLEKDGVPREAGPGPARVATWWREEFGGEKGVIDRSEAYLSNWFPIIRFPAVWVHRLAGPLGRWTRRSYAYPAFEHGECLVSFATATELGSTDGYRPAIRDSESLSVDALLRGGRAGVDARAASNAVKFLARRCLEGRLTGAGLRMTHLGERIRCFYFLDGFAEDNKATFTGLDGRARWRKLVGTASLGRGREGPRTAFWHFGVDVGVRFAPVAAYVIRPHVVFSDDGSDLWVSRLRQHRARRRHCRLWWNAHWRDRLLAVVSWLGGNEQEVRLPVGKDAAMLVGTQPLVFRSPVSYSLRARPDIAVYNGAADDEQT